MREHHDEVCKSTREILDTGFVLTKLGDSFSRIATVLVETVSSKSQIPEVKAVVSSKLSI